MTVREYLNRALLRYYRTCILAMFAFFGGLAVIVPLLGEGKLAAWVGVAYLVALVCLCGWIQRRKRCPFCGAKILVLLASRTRVPKEMRHLPCCGAEIDGPMPDGTDVESRRSKVKGS